MKGEMRREARARHDSVVELFDDEGRLLDRRVRLADVSPGGACFSSPEPFSLGERLQARVRLVKEGIKDVPVVVVWSMTKGNAHLYGVRFG